VEGGQQATTRLPLSMYQVGSVLEEAIADWRAAGVGDERLGSINIVIRDLPGLVLGRFEDNTLYLDTDAAGYGWFIDATPGDNAEFTSTADGLLAKSGRAANTIDLLTVVRHELAHALGFEHSGEGVTAGLLPQGRRMQVEPVAVAQHAAPESGNGLVTAAIVSVARVEGARFENAGFENAGFENEVGEVGSAVPQRLGAAAGAQAFYVEARPEQARFMGATAVHVDLKAALAQTLYFDEETGELATEIVRQSLGAPSLDVHQVATVNDRGHDADDWVVRDRDDVAADFRAGAKSGAGIDWARSQESSISAGILPGFLATLRLIARPLRGRGR